MCQLGPTSAENSTLRFAGVRLSGWVGGGGSVSGHPASQFSHGSVQRLDFANDDNPSANVRYNNLAFFGASMFEALMFSALVIFWIRDINCSKMTKAPFHAMN